jgi:type IV pilus assembly protein PilW
VITVFAKTRDLYRTNESAAQLQETARYAMSTIEADLRMTNYWGFNNRADLIENAPGLDPDDPAEPDPAYSLPADLNAFATTISACGGMWAVKVVAYIEAANNGYELDCAEFGTAVAAADQLTIRRASAEVIAPAALAGTAGQIKLRSSRTRGALFGGTALPAGYAEPDLETRAVVVHGYYVDQDSNLRAGTPSLRRKALGFAGGAPVILDEEIVPGVEDLQVQLGVDANADQNADYFVDPDVAVPAADAVVAARVWLLVRSEQPEVGFTDDRVYEYADRSIADDTAYAPADGFRRLLVSKTIALRNTRR